jgi:protein involved in polysaccharide export with SLBB domain
MPRAHISLGRMLRVRSIIPLLLLVSAGGAAHAQQAEWDPRRVYATREALEALYQRYQASAESPAYSDVLRDQARRLAEAVHQRLENGDFQVGDRIRLAVEDEKALSDTFTVVEGPEVVLPTLGPVSLKGVLRSEIQPYLQTHIARYIKDPAVQARSYIRISVQGEVIRPGFYTLPTDIVISDALQAASGFTASAKLGDITIVRGDRTAWDAAAVQRAVVDGTTLDQLGIRAGDRIVVASKPKSLGSFEGGMRTLVMIITIPATVAGLIAIFKK